MDKLNAEQQARAIALEAAARIITENLRFMTRVNSHASRDAEASRNAVLAAQATTDLARHFEGYLMGAEDSGAAR